MSAPAVECHNCGLPDYPAVIEVGKPYVCAHCRRFAAAAARRERVRKAVEEALRAMPWNDIGFFEIGGVLEELDYPALAQIATDAALAALDNEPEA
jgi:hypothetical protein